MRPRLAVIVSLVILPACAGSTTTRSTRPLRTGSEPNLITWFELQSVPDVTTLYGAIVRLRPRFLDRYRAPVPEVGRSRAVQVYIDGLYMGDAAVLEDFRPSDVASVRYLRPSEAFARFGNMHGEGGVLLVTLNASRR
ncbi:MAG TPA: hypothetical protein VFY16_10205 [Gemmatimonadaceae bacterium]|jgi:hypothetical protein|nr:hypothetical protein [Gemmatimonadaceae bacterium]